MTDFGPDTDTLADLSSLSFEDALKALEDVVRKLESGEAPLDQSIALYARGDALRKHCQTRLDSAQARIEAIVADREGNAVGTRPFDESTGA
ncbi:exodeoxyribonuclease VII small subunit [Novosphingobium sp.]|uniref:exodeoxyribonuclease VII small subunit n=1 Tax=Novosphingobium sp. TaxID=1874826 RepID=UPI0025CC4065|nr:exodeoxyribonuclease VII small subunit [Novosphingobium sp.]